jgi:type IV pilus assembly protein PilO
MAGFSDSMGQMPWWQKLLIWLFVSAAIVAAWWFFFWTETVSKRQGAEDALATATAELERVQKRKANFMAEQEQHEKNEKELDEKMKVLPMNASTVDNLMQTFQQQARLVGLSVDDWKNEPEERLDYYARLPIKIVARGSWSEAGEFFRRLHGEIDQIVSVENLKLTLGPTAGSRKDENPEHPELAVEFEAATYRFLSAQERAAGSGDAKKGGTRRGKEGAK